ncbi:dephospho-CoA kinase [Schinkia azotoformans MEV2011]|uniref:Dephospho-CoA kinase n=1 Tax=Schinkia azotoformans MEV2011 TaxID=1348973 RepID=A0A072P243_SCHAZ|nr:dephospho-CoA kinase [Schinkia azotoformans]KEF39560.1 dephospho-CoA kinase [Schinkia azotoformans MEV2011]MEC1694250.1 dephospho-CoA kinase [Schinkia azotoformans]MEC1714949.1 dephospho-CoA kinase [Schinkia azotoformans]MEC1723536.1 dephospho-CoA kinase [Schinkia azotoformans]MEC1742886.1 dephospho-CoA kinase [Schinkia azotoformans]
MTTVLGLTGGIASGKSTVATMLRDLGIVIIDADVIAREVVEVGEDAYFKIIGAFGRTILHDDRTINRQKLGEVIFNNEQKRKVLNSIVHPAVREKMSRLKMEFIEKGEKIIVLDIPLLFESKQTHLVEKVILVYVDRDVQVKRLMQRNGLSVEEAEARINSQMPLTEKIPLADAVINNNGSIEETKEQLLAILKQWELI